MLAGLAPISAYRTLDLPALELAYCDGSMVPSAPPELGGLVRKAMRAAGVGVRVLDPVEVAMERVASRNDRSKPVPEAIADPALAGWLFGSSWVPTKGNGHRYFASSNPNRSRIWPGSCP